MKENKSTTVLLTVIGIATLLVAVVGATFAYFTATVYDTNSDATNVNVKGATLGTVTFTHGDVINVTDIYPGWEQTIEFTVTADPNSTVPVNYDVYLDTLTNALGPNYTSAAGVDTARVETENLVAFLEGPDGATINLAQVDSSNPLPAYGSASYQTAGTPLSIAGYAPSSNNIIASAVLAPYDTVNDQDSVDTWRLTVRLREMDVDQINDQGRTYSAKIRVVAADNYKYTAAGTNGTGRAQWTTTAGD